jgi:hypothetical protein
MYEGEEVTAEPTQVGRRDRHHGVRGDRRVDRVSTTFEGRRTGGGGEVIGRGDHMVRCPHGRVAPSIVAPSIVVRHVGQIPRAA